MTWRRLLICSILTALADPCRAEDDGLKLPQLLFENGKLLKESARSISGIFGGRKAKLNLAAERLQLLIKKYPKDANCAEAAYLIGEIYTDIQVKEYKKAVQYYLKSFEIDPKVKPEVIYLAAEITDKKIKNAKEAARLYQKVLDHSVIEKDRRKAMKRLEKLREIGFDGKPEETGQP